MNKNVAHALVWGLLFSSVFSAVCARSDWTIGAISTIIVPDGYSTIQEAINNASEGDTILIRAGTYYEHVVVNKTVSLIGDDPSTTILDGNNTGNVVHIVSDYVNVTGFTVQRCGNAQLDAGICLNNSAGCLISGNRLMDIGSCGISLLYSQQNKVIGNNITRSNWGGIHLLGSTNNTVSGNIVENTYGGINGHVSSNYNEITENVISNSTHGMFYHASSRNSICRNRILNISAEGIWLQDQVNYNLVAENNLFNNTVAIRLQGPNHHNNLSRNTIAVADYGVKIEQQADSNIVSGNTIASCQFGIQVLNARYTDISNNTIAHNYGSDWDAGVRLEYAGNTIIRDNEIFDNWRGILLYASSPYVSVQGNNVTANEYGIRVASGGSNYLNLSDNIVMNNRGYGIGLTGFGGGSNYATVARNLIVNNTLEGISIGQGSNYNTIVQNSLIENGYGIYFDSVGYSTRNMIFNNNMINNTQQVRIASGSVNAWNGSYASGGNYWSDYDGTDANGDGFGDTPYAIDADNQDNYPLVSPYEYWCNPIPGDVDRDMKVDMRDILSCCCAFNTNPTHPRWNSYSDLNLDERVDIRDIAIVCGNFGKHYA